MYTARKTLPTGKNMAMEKLITRVGIAFAMYLVIISFSLLEAQPQTLRFLLGVERK